MYEKLNVPPERLHRFLTSRRSVRRFVDTPVAESVLERILETATWVPSAHNQQPWRFVVLTTLQARTRLTDEMGGEFRRDLEMDDLAPQKVAASVELSRQRILGAPVVIVLCMDTSCGDDYPDERRQTAEFLMGVQSVSETYKFRKAHCESFAVLLISHFRSVGVNAYFYVAQIKREISTDHFLIVFGSGSYIDGKENLMPLDPSSMNEETLRENIMSSCIYFDGKYVDGGLLID